MNFKELKDTRDAEGMIWFLNTICDNPQRYSKMSLAVMTCFLDWGLIDQVALLLESNGITVDTVEDVDKGIILTRYLLATEQVDDAVSLFERMINRGQTRKRQISLIVEHTQSVEIYVNHLLPYFTPDATDIVSVMDSGDPDTIIRPVVGQPIFFTEMDNVLMFEGVTAPDSYQLVKMPIDTDTLEQNILEIFEGKECEVEGTYDVVIDGANVMCYGDRKFSKDSYTKLDRMIRALSRQFDRILLVLHRRHLDTKKVKKMGVDKLVNSWNSNQKLTVKKTPYNMNDDWYSIIAALRSYPCYLVTNDQFRDHVNKFSFSDRRLNMLREWRTDYGLEYTFGKKFSQVTLQVPPEFSHRIQKSDNGYYLPTEDSNVWFFVPITE